MPGGLNAPLAAAMNDLAGLNSSDRYLNAMCGSGTLLIERALLRGSKALVGVDKHEKALECARTNIAVAGLTANIDLLQADATRLPFAEASFDVITADLPWGDAVGSHAANASLYPTFLREMARLSSAKTRLVVLTHDIKLLEQILASQPNWQSKRSFQVFHSGHHPKLYLLQKTG
jgi:23S rRNA G2445 N2-methylase RlmL